MKKKQKTKKKLSFEGLRCEHEKKNQMTSVRSEKN